MARRTLRPHDLPDVFVGSHAVAEGILTPAQLRGTSVRRVLHGVYRPAWVRQTHELTCRAAALVLPPGAVVTGTSAARLLGVVVADADDVVQVRAGAGVDVVRRRGLRVRDSVRPVSTRWLREVPVADPAVTAFDLTTSVTLPVAVARLDSFLRAGQLTAQELDRYLDGCHEPGVVAARAAAALVDVRAESPPESVLRVHLLAAGVDVVAQHEVRDARGRFLARVDLAVPGARVAVEYDGAWHSSREQLGRDRARLNALTAAGWLVVHVTAEMMRDPAAVVAVVRAALDRRAA